MMNFEMESSLTVLTMTINVGSFLGSFSAADILNLWIVVVMESFTPGRSPKMNNLTAYRVFLNDGSNYVTSMAKDVTLEMARDYFMGQWFEQSDGKTMLQAIDVQEVA